MLQKMLSMIFEKLLDGEIILKVNKLKIRSAIF